MTIFGSTKSNRVVTEVGSRVGKSIEEQQREQEANVSLIRQLNLTKVGMSLMGF